MKKFACLILTCAAASGCMTVNAELPGTLRADVAAADTERIGQLSIEKGNWFFLYGLLGSPDKTFLSADIAKAVQAKGGDGVANLKYESSEGIVDMVIGACSFGCVDPRSYKVTGDIVRIKKPPLPGKPAKVATSKAAAPVVVASQQY